jgi:LAS superfamily LD-carboxypeptidase LdcB
LLSLAKLQKYVILAGCALSLSLGVQSCQPKYEDPGVAQYHNPPIAEQIAESFPGLPELVISDPTPVASAFNNPPVVAPTLIQAALASSSAPATQQLASKQAVTPPVTKPAKIAPTTKLAKILAGELAPTSSTTSRSPTNSATIPKTSTNNITSSYPVAISVNNQVAQKYAGIAQRTGYLERYPEISSAETTEYQGHRLHRDAANAFNQMRRAAAQENVTLQVVSGFRSIQTQVNIFEGKGGGLGAAQYSAPPGHSQHHTGLAIDINSLSPSFRNTKAFSWLTAHGREHGFMLSYANTSGDLGPNNEPWHWVYAGKPPAMKLMADFLSRARQFNYDPLAGNKQLETIYRSQSGNTSTKVS